MFQTSVSKNLPMPGNSKSVVTGASRFGEPAGKCEINDLLDEIQRGAAGSVGVFDENRLRVDDVLARRPGVVARVSRHRCFEQATTTSGLRRPRARRRRP